jgi:DNA-directed RNA polymerase specialized sigma24 family protein
MDEQEWLAERFEEHRARLRAVAYRMLGSLSEADDAVQDAWLRLARAGGRVGACICRPGERSGWRALGVRGRRGESFEDC